MYISIVYHFTLSVCAYLYIFKGSISISVSLSLFMYFCLPVSVYWYISPSVFALPDYLHNLTTVVRPACPSIVFWAF